MLSLVASLVASFAYFRAVQSKLDADAGYWKRLARFAFITETISVFAIFGILFYIIYNHLFEYKYAWQHSSRSLEFKYLLSCFWEGQEGSTLLWSIWHCVLGLVFIKTGGKWEAPVMSVVSFAQFCLASMLTGLYVFGWRMGSNPFQLLRDSGVLDNVQHLHINGDIHLPLRQDYLSFVTDGNDLNPLLQNYWMVIHPPVLFLGFASTIIPFAYAIAGLWTKNYGGWTKPALPWSLFSLATLGIGIMMGAAWAYESLTFGGFWAWDPVENASLVPWLILVAGVHTLLIYKHTGHSLRATYLFFILTFGFILYSTFLTKSGILGEASVHSFTDSGMSVQLLVFLLLFVVPPLLFFFARYREIPSIQKEEQTSSREFWMFIGSLVFFLSALVIIGKTSLPVVNKIFGSNLAAPEDQEFAYNQIQVFVAIIVGFLTAFTQYLKYRSTPGGFFRKQVWLPTLVSLVIGTLVLAFGDINYQKHGLGFLGAIWLAIVASIYAAVANLAYIWIGMKGKLKLSGGSVSHFGFGLVLLGILISASKKEILSHNTSGIAIPFGNESKEKTGENLTLVKGVPMKMGKFDVTYLGDSAHPRKQQWYFFIHFKSRIDDEEFTLKPNAFVNYKGNENLMANPDSRHYWNSDLFTYISALPNPEKNKDTTEFTSQTIGIGDSIYYSKGYLVLESLTTRDSLPFAGFEPGDRATVANLRVYSRNSTSYAANPLLIQKGAMNLPTADTVMSEALVVRLSNLDGDKAEIGIKESDAVLQYVTLKAYKFPYINILWLGIIITAVGIFMSMSRRISLNRRGTAD